MMPATLARKIIIICVMLSSIILFSSASLGAPENPEQSNMKTEDVIAWATEAIEATFTYNFDDYQSRLQNAEKYYTASAWSAYMKALDLSQNTKALVERKQKVIAKVMTTGTDKPKLISEGLSGGAYTWKLEVPIKITYQMPPYNESNDSSSAQIVTITIQRQSLHQGYKGLAITDLSSSLYLPQ